MNLGRSGVRLLVQMKDCAVLSEDGLRTLALQPIPV